MKKVLGALLVLLVFTFAIPNLVDARRHSDDTEQCWNCGGSGNCRYCDGEGYIEEYDSERDEYVKITCDVCNGSGHCYICGGVGWL